MFCLDGFLTSYKSQLIAVKNVFQLPRDFQILDFVLSTFSPTGFVACPVNQGQFSTKVAVNPELLQVETLCINFPHLTFRSFNLSSFKGFKRNQRDCQSFQQMQLKLDWFFVLEFPRSFQEIRLVFNFYGNLNLYTVEFKSSCATRKGKCKLKFF